MLQASPIQCPPSPAVTGGQCATFGCQHSLRERLLGRWIWVSKPEETRHTHGCSSVLSMGEPTKVSNKTQFTAYGPEVLRLLEEQAEEGRQ